MAGAELQELLQMVEELAIQNNAAELAGSMALANSLNVRFIGLRNHIQNTHNPSPARNRILHLLNGIIILLPLAGMNGKVNQQDEAFNEQ